MAAAHDDYKPSTVTLALNHPKLELLTSRTPEQLLKFVETRGQKSKEHLSELVVKNIAFLESQSHELENIQQRIERRQNRLNKFQEQQNEMERESNILSQKNVVLQKEIEELEEKVKNEAENLKTHRTAKHDIEFKMDAEFLKKANKYLENHSEIPVVNMISFFVGLLRNDHEVTPMDTELIFKNFSSFQTKLRQVDPAKLSDRVLDYFEPQVQLYKKFMQGGPDVAKYVDYDGNYEREMPSEEEGKRLIEHQRKIMTPWVNFLDWADEFLQESRKAVFTFKAQSQIDEKKKQIDENSKAIQHSQIVVDNLQNDGVISGLKEEQNREQETRGLVQCLIHEFGQVNERKKVIYKKFEDNYFQSAHNKFSEEKRQNNSPQK